MTLTVAKILFTSFCARTGRPARMVAATRLLSLCLPLLIGGTLLQAQGETRAPLQDSSLRGPIVRPSGAVLRSRPTNMGDGERIPHGVAPSTPDGSYVPSSTAWVPPFSSISGGQFPRTGVRPSTDPSRTPADTVSGQRRSRGEQIGRGALIGTGVGAIVGAGTAFVVSRQARVIDHSEDVLGFIVYTVYGAVAGLLVGTVTGALVGR